MCYRLVGREVLDFNRLLAFHTVARHLSFSRAADELYTSQPNVSRQISKLESELGLALFQRTGNRVLLTDAGRLVEDYAQRTFELTDAMHRSLNELKGLERGYLRVAAGSTSGLYILPEAIAGFQRQHPALDVTLQISNSQEALSRVLDSTADLAFVDAALSTPAVQLQPYAQDELILVAAPQRLAGLKGMTRDALGSETLLLREIGSGTRRVTEDALQHWNVQPGHMLVVNHSEALKQGAMAGLGLAFVPARAVALEVKQGLLAVLGGQEWRISRQLLVATRKDLRPPLTGLAFLAYLRKMRPGER